MPQPDGSTRTDRQHPLRVPLNDLRSRPRNPRRVELEVVLDELSVADSRVDPNVAVEIDVDLEAAAEGVTVVGRLVGRWLGSCNLCLGEVGGDLEAAVNELYADEPLDEETYKLHPEYVDLEPLVNDAVMLELPVLVRCPFGGVGQCDKVPKALEPEEAEADAPEQRLADPRWAALDGLSFDEG